MNKFTKFVFGAALAVAFFIGAAAYAYDFGTATLSQGSSGTYVVELQSALNANGANPALVTDGAFGSATKSAVMAYQSMKGLVADGIVGPATKAALNDGSSMTYPEGCTSSSGFSTTTGESCASTSTMPAGCMAGYMFSPTTGESCTGGPSPSNPTLSGGAGSIDQADFISEYSNEEVGEDEEDVVVAGLTIEADEGSDIEITAVTLDFDYADSGADDDLDEYASEVSVWFDGEEVARVDASDFDDDNDYSRTVSLDGAMIDAGDEGDLTVAVSGISNLDSSNAGEKWNVAFESVRFLDADGAVISDTSTGDITDGNDDTTTDAGEREFSFETFATSSDIELSVSLTDDQDDINDAHVIDIDDTDDTDDVEILAFTLEVEGDSSITVDEIPVLFTSVEATGNDPDDLASSATLIYDGEEIGSENFLTSDGDGSTETITFDDLDLDLDEGEHEFIVTVDFLSTADTLDAGDTLKAEITSTERDAIDAEDETGENIASGDRTGTALGEASELRDSGIMVELVETSATVDYGDVTATNDHDLATFAMTFEVTAFDADMYIDNTDPALTGGGTAHDLTLTGSGTVVDADITAADNSIEATNSFLVEEGQSEEFTITVVITPTSDGLFQLALGSVLYATTDVDGTVEYTFNLEDFLTESVYLNNDAA